MGGFLAMKASESATWVSKSTWSFDLFSKRNCYVGFQVHVVFLSF